MQNTLSAKSVFKEAYAIMKPRLWLVLGQFCVVLFISAVLDFLVKNNLFLSVVVSTIFAFVTTSMALGYAEKKHFSFSSFEKKITLKKVGFFIATFVIVKIIIYIGFFLLLVPGVIAALQLFPAKYLAIETAHTPIQILKKSRAMTKGKRWQILECVFLAAAINIAGVLCLIVGLFFTVPLTVIAFALMYKKLASMPEVKTEEASSEKEAETVVVEAEVVAA
ncbi:MAG: hypothetical protein WCG55_04630 [bacterium]